MTTDLAGAATVKDTFTGRGRLSRKRATVNLEQFPKPITAVTFQTATPTPKVVFAGTGSLGTVGGPTALTGSAAVTFTGTGALLVVISLNGTGTVAFSGTGLLSSPDIRGAATNKVTFTGRGQLSVLRGTVVVEQFPPAVGPLLTRARITFSGSGTLNAAGPMDPQPIAASSLLGLTSTVTLSDVDSIVPIAASSVLELTSLATLNYGEPIAAITTLVLRSMVTLAVGLVESIEADSDLALTSTVTLQGVAPPYTGSASSDFLVLLSTVRLSSAAPISAASALRLTSSVHLTTHRVAAFADSTLALTSAVTLDETPNPELRGGVGFVVEFV